MNIRRPSDWNAHNELAAESIERQRQARLLREWVNKQQNPRAGQRRHKSFAAKAWASFDVDARVATACIIALFALAAIIRTWG